MNNEKKKPSTKKIVAYYLILAACILVVAAITVSVVFAVNKNRDITVDTPNDVVDSDDKNDNNDDDKKPPIVDTSTATEFISPVSNVVLMRDMAFFHNATLKNYYEHCGYDFSGEVGDEIYSVVDGKVIEIYTEDMLDGGVVKIEHANGVNTVYKFINPASTLKVGDTISRGTVIGTIAEPCGNEKNDGAHLHFEVYKNGALCDPSNFLDYNNK